MELIFFLTILKGRMVLQWRSRGKRWASRTVVDHKDMADCIAKTMQRLHVNWDNCVVMCSSSLDFPQEHTKDPKIIAWANKIRSV